MPGGAWLAACACQLQLESPSVWCRLEGSSLNFKMSKEPGAPQSGLAPTTEPIWSGPRRSFWRERWMLQHPVWQPCVGPRAE